MANRRRPFREKVRRILSLVPSAWSSWYVALVPEIHGDGSEYEERSDGHEGFIYRNIEERFRQQRYDNGIYELRVSREGDHYVVYIGRSLSQDPNSISGRIGEYCRDGSHLDDLINRAMERGYTLSVRAKGISGTDEDVLEGEELYLNEYDYAWNKTNNGDKRENVPPP